MTIQQDHSDDAVPIAPHLHTTPRDAQSHSYFDGAVTVTEFNFTGDDSMNDAEISIQGRYPLTGYAINDLSTALISVDSGSGFVTIKDAEPQELAVGDRLLIKPGEPYALTAPDAITIRYIATPAWTPSQSRIIND